MVGLLKEVELGAKVGDTCRKHGISDATYYKWIANIQGCPCRLWPKCGSCRTRTLSSSACMPICRSCTVP
ncbi:transposase [Comamonas thiooxydans]|uniref:transposase n=1 Tax=Comamonas thiooxydans TaxID=363952 RepID=UPI003F80A843